VDFASAGRKINPIDPQTYLFDQSFQFGDTAIASLDGKYSLIYYKIGTKALLLKDGLILRELNRSYYMADVYEYPGVFMTLNNRTYLIHCPFHYSRLDIEDVESGEILTDKVDRKPEDFFHSRLEISPNGKYLLSKGWIWHPWDCIKVFDIELGLMEPNTFDKFRIFPEVGTEVSAAFFIDDHRVLMGSSEEEPIDEDETNNLPPKHMAIWDIRSHQISKPMKINYDFGNLFAINHELAWDLYKYPKILRYTTGDLIDMEENINSGIQNSSIIHHLEITIKSVYNPISKSLAIENDGYIEILQPF